MKKIQEKLSILTFFVAFLSHVTKKYWTNKLKFLDSQSVDK